MTGQGRARETVLTPLQQQKARVEVKLRNELGPDICGFLDDDDVIDVMTNPDGTIWCDRMSVGMSRTGIAIPSSQIENTICTVAYMHNGSVANETTPRVRVELRLPGGPRFQGTLPPVAQPFYVIRKHTKRVITLLEQVIQGTVTPAQAAILVDALTQRKNVLIAGATLSGKTVLLDSLMDTMCVIFGILLRLLVIEDTFELHCPAKNKVAKHTSPEFTMRDLILDTLRERPDRIIVGEVRGPEAWDMLTALNSGHSGSLSTIHADSAAQALDKLEMLIEHAGVINKQRMIALAINMVVMMQRPGPSEWQVKEIVQVDGWDDAKRQYQFTTLSQRAPVSTTTAAVMDLTALQ